MLHRFFPSARSTTPRSRRGSSLVLVALVGVLGVGAIACGSPNAETPDAEQTQPSDPVKQQLQGRWEIESAPDGTENAPNLVFTSDGKLYFLTKPPGADKEAAIEVGFTINSDAEPMAIDLTFPGSTEPVLTIFELTPDGKFRMDVSGRPGNERPTAFSEQVAVFTKASDEASLPDGVEVVDLQAEVNRAKTAEARNYVGAMNRAQQAFFLEKSEFANTLEDLGLGLEPETDNYSYKISATSDGGAVMTATAKNDQLKSYTGVVFLDQPEQKVTKAVICETDDPSQTPPDVSVDVVGPDFQCPAGSSAL